MPYLQNQCSNKMVIERPSMIINYAQNHIYFNSTFDEPLENYIHIIRHIRKIIFYRITHSYGGYGFVQKCPYNHRIVLTKNIMILALPDNYNVEIILSKNMISLDVGNKYNRYIKFPKKFECLTLGLMYDKPLELGKCTKRLIMGSSYNSVVLMTKNMRYLHVDDDYNCVLVLPKNLTRLEFSYGSVFDGSIILTKRLKIFKPCSNYGETCDWIEYPFKKIHIPCGQFFRIYDNLPNGQCGCTISSSQNMLFNIPSGYKILC